MATEAVESGAYCSHCETMRLFRASVPKCNHLVHAIVTLFLCGLWIPVWAIAAFDAENRRQRVRAICSVCGLPWTPPAQPAPVEAQVVAEVVQPPPLPKPKAIAPISFRCPQCGLAFRESPAIVGKRAKCKQCATVFVVPGTSSPTAG